MLKIALQLYSLRNELEADLDGTLKKVAEAGYDGVETFSLYDLSASGMRKKLDALGLTCVSMHVMDRDIGKIIEDAKTLGAEFLVIPWSTWEKDADGLETLKFIKENADKVRAAGLKWLYHNHDHEFKKWESGKNFFDLLLPGTDANQINLQVDTYWVEKAGVSLADFIYENRSRIRCFHLKDEREIGIGNIDFNFVLRMAKELGHEWVIIEQEEFDNDPFDCIGISLANVKNIAAKIG